jgi:hypothetical protein
MGMQTRAAIAAFEEKAGIKRPTGELAEVLSGLSQVAFEMIKVIELERSGIRDGDGYWHGSDPVSGTAEEFVALCRQLEDIRRGPDIEPDEEFHLALEEGKHSYCDPRPGAR